ncbi:phage major capsid protein [Luteitalea sp.]
MQIISSKVRARDAAISEAERLIARAQHEERLLTAAERSAVDAKMAEARRLGQSIEAARQDRRLAEEIAALRSSGARTTEGVAELYRQDGVSGGRPAWSLGEQFVQSNAYRAIASVTKAGRWQGPAVDFDCATLLSSGAGSGGDLKLPEYEAGILELLFGRRSALALFPTAVTGANAIGYFRELAFTNAADARPEGAAAAESALTFAKTIDPVESIAHWLPVADEMLGDVSALRGYIDARLSLGLEVRVEGQVLAGNGTSPNMSGLLNRPDLATMITQTGTALAPTESLADAIHRQITVITETNLIMPDAIVMSPSLWEQIALQKDTTGRYLSNGPSSVAPTMLWGLPVVRSPLMPTGDALVGAFVSGAQIFYRTAVTIDVSNSHGDNFTSLITAIRAVRRLALAVYRPAGFGLVRKAA